MSTFVLVHGAWHGGWCWRRVAPLLGAAGHDVFTPTLSGLGERSNAATGAIDLDTHVQDVAAVLSFEDLRDVVLVGHSYGGMVITGVAANSPERLGHLVYLDAFVPAPGQALIDFVGGAAGGIRRTAEANDGLLPPLPVQAYGVHDEQDAAWVGERLRPQPVGTFVQPVAPWGDAAGAINRTYIFCLERMGPFDQFAERFRSSSTWRYHELDTGHDAMLIAPQELSAILLQVA